MRHGLPRKKGAAQRRQPLDCNAQKRTQKASLVYQIRPKLSRARRTGGKRMAESIIKVKRREGFTVLPNSTLRDNRLSLKTRAILAIMISVPEDWDFTVSGLAVICGTGRDAVRSSLRELEACGYLELIHKLEKL